MNRTLILYDGKQSSAERSAERLCYVVGSAKAVEIDEAPEDLSCYAGVCFVFQFYGSVTTGKVKNYMVTHREVLSEKRLAAVGVGYSDLGYTKYVVDMEKEVGLDGIASYFLSSNSHTTRAGYEIGRMMRAPKKAMEEEELMASIRSFIEAHTALALATATDGYIRCTPLAYTFLDDCFYIATEGGNKFRGIIENGRVSAAIYDSYENLKETASLQLLGEAEIVSVGSPEYQVAMTAMHITEERLQELPVTMFLIRVTPLRYDFTNPAFEESGFDASQAMTTSKEKKKSKEGQEYFVREKAKGQPTYTILGENGEEKQVTIPEVETTAIPGFYDMNLTGEPDKTSAGNGDSSSLTPEEKAKKREEVLKKRRRKKALLEKRRREAAERDTKTNGSETAAGDAYERAESASSAFESGGESGGAYVRGEGVTYSFEGESITSDAAELEANQSAAAELKTETMTSDVISSDDSGASESLNIDIPAYSKKSTEPAKSTEQTFGAEGTEDDWRLDIDEELIRDVKKNSGRERNNRSREASGTEKEKDRSGKKRNSVKNKSDKNRSDKNRSDKNKSGKNHSAKQKGSGKKHWNIFSRLGDLLRLEDDEDEDDFEDQEI